MTPGPGAGGGQHRQQRAHFMIAAQAPRPIAATLTSRSSFRLASRNSTRSAAYCASSTAIRCGLSGSVIGSPYPPGGLHGQGKTSRKGFGSVYQRIVP